MAGMPETLAIALWITTACWVVAAIAYFLDADTSIIAPLIILGVMTGVAEWLLRRKT